MYIVIEGIDGCGKDTQADLLVGWLTSKGYDPLRVNEPDSELPTGRILRELLRSGEHQSAHAALFVADRMALGAAKILPALEAGRPVVSARSFLSTLAYQQENWPLDWLLCLHQQLPARPDLVVILTMDPNEALARVIGRGGKVEVYERREVQHRNARRYLELAGNLGVRALLRPDSKVVLIEASGSAEEVFSRIRPVAEAMIGGSDG